MARLIDTDTEKSSSSTFKPDSNKPNELKMNTAFPSHTPQTQRKFSFKTKQHHFNQQKLTMSKIKVSTNSTVAELANKFNAIIVDDSTKSISKQLKRKLSNNNNTFHRKKIPNTVKEAIQIFEQPEPKGNITNKIQPKTNNFVGILEKQGSVGILEKQVSGEFHLKKNSKIILIRKHSSPRAQKISSKNSDPIENKIKLKLKPFEVESPGTSCETCLKLTPLRPTISMDSKINETNTKIKRPYSVSTSLNQNNQQKFWRETTSNKNECENLLMDIKKNLRHTSMINLNNVHNSEEKTDVINRHFNTLKPALKPKPSHDFNKDRRKSISDIQFLQKSTSVQPNHNVQISFLHKQKAGTLNNASNLGHIFKQALSTKDVSQIFEDFKKSKSNHTDDAEEDIVDSEHRKNLETQNKFMKTHRLSIPKISVGLENILNHQNDLNINTQGEDLKEILNNEKSATLNFKTNNISIESNNTTGKSDVKFNDIDFTKTIERTNNDKTNPTTQQPFNPKSNIIKNNENINSGIDNKSVQSKPNSSFLWRRTLTKDTKSNDSIMNTIKNDENCGIIDYEVYTYIEMNGLDDKIIKTDTTFQKANVNHQSLPNLNQNDIDDTYEELNYFPGKIDIPNIPNKTSSTLPKLPQKNKQLIETIPESTLTVCHPTNCLQKGHQCEYYNGTDLNEVTNEREVKINVYHEPVLQTKPAVKKDFNNYQVLSNIDDRYATIVKPKREPIEGSYAYESISSVKDDSECHYASINDNVYDDVLNIIQLDNCYESIKAESDCGSSWEKDNSIYGIKAPSVLSNTSTLSTASDFYDTSDEWVDMDQSDDDQHIFVYRPKKVLRPSSMNKNSWSQKVRNQRSKLSNANSIVKKVGIKSTSIVVLTSTASTTNDLSSAKLIPKHTIDSDSATLTELRCHNKCGVSHEAQELNVFLQSEETSLHSTDSNTYKNSSHDEQDSFSDSFDSESDVSSETDNRENHFPIHQRSLPPPPIHASSNHLNQNIYGFVKQAGRQMKSLSTLGLSKIRKMSVEAISQLPVSLPKSPETEIKPNNIPSTTLPTRARRWSSFKTKFRPHSKSTFYLNEDESLDPLKLNKTEDYANVSPTPPKPPERDYRRKSIAVGPSLEKDIRRQSIASRPSSPPPPPPVNRSLSSDESSSNVSKSEKSFHPPSWYAESTLFDHELSDPNKSSPNKGNNFWYSDNILWDSGNSSTPGASNSDSMSDPGSDLNLRFIDEPLYQFYNACVTELQFNEGSEENGYEEIGSTTTRPSMLEIVAPSNINRSLWCQLPEVIDSGILENLDSAERKLQEAKFELITSEASYFKSLTILEKQFIASPLLTDESVICKNDRKHLFGNVAAVRKCSEKLLAALEQCWQDSILLNNICEVMYQHVTNKSFNIYIKYCSNQFHIDRTLKALREGNPKFCEVLSELESNSICQSLSLHSFLMLPMQRITRLPLLFDAILTRLKPNHTEYEACHTTLATLNKIVHECNEEARKMERYYEMLLLSRLIKFSLKEVKCLPVISSSRWLVRSGSLNFVNLDSKMTFNKKMAKSHFYSKLYLFLFTDLLIITKNKSDGSYAVIDYCPRAMMEMVAMDDSIPSTNKYLLLLTILENHENKTVEMVLSCDTESGRQRWIEATAPPSSSNPEETLYEQWDCPQVAANHAYKAQQPDELNLQPGDIINVLRKMSDGWYNGERIRDGQKGWFPGNYTSEIASSHARAKNLKQRYRLLALSSSYLQSQQIMKKKITS